jgi:ABC-type dipeptide/oligopeptide/nickel transport system ATPase component
MGSVDEIFHAPKTAVTKRLLDAVLEPTAAA